MKNLIFAFLVLTTFACSKQEPICDRTICEYRLPSYTDCTPDDGKWDTIKVIVLYDTIPNECPVAVESQFYKQLEKTYNLPTTGDEYRKFADEYPATCNCK